MAKTMTIQQATALAGELMAAQGFPGARPVSVAQSHAAIDVERTFNIQGAVVVSFNVDFSDGKQMKYRPVVRVNVPAFNSGVVEATAMLGLFQELTMFAASLQAQLDQYEIPAE